MTASSPGKCILSGEHAVVHGRPALAAAISLRTRAEIRAQADGTIRLTFAGRAERRLAVAELAAHLKGLHERHAAFLQGDLAVRAVAPAPEDLLLGAVAMAEPAEGYDIRVSSDIPVGSGMGSSAAVLLALLRALRPDWGKERLEEAALACEHFQHGRSSGIDVAASLHGGLVFGVRGRFAPLPMGTLPKLTLLHSGPPRSTTGECVARVSARFPSTDPIWNDFEATTRALLDALQRGDASVRRAALRINHRLLCRIGVVPDAVREYIEAVEREGGAAKVCGAGSVSPGPAGLVWVDADALPPPPADWTPLALSVTPLGTTLETD